MYRDYYNNCAKWDNERTVYRALDKYVPFFAVFIHLTTKYEKTASMTRVDTCYSKTVVHVTEDIEQEAWGDQESWWSG